MILVVISWTIPLVSLSGLSSYFMLADYRILLGDKSANFGLRTNAVLFTTEYSTRSVKYTNDKMTLT
ncbi:hypothetical protein EB796_004852 [Bugula neritina]|uniref:Uncharacterized protein n=1 Tax=Bugula neritina TaxID=10212 RepID=A0A7J7KF64_BUGNE|nr:hypothetical protein EB796_004852 [Bugula neritina]